MVCTDSEELVALGWREWVHLPSWSEAAIKAKLDTGARTSAIHAFALEIVAEGSGERARFEIHPHQDSAADSTEVETEVTGYREVRSSNGAVELRPAVVTELALGGRSFPIEITLTDRDPMGYRLLLGRSALRRRFLVDSDRSYVSGTR